MSRPSLEAEENRSRFDRKIQQAIAHIKLRPGGLTEKNLLTILGGTNAENRAVLDWLKERSQVICLIPPGYTQEYFYPVGHRIKRLRCQPRPEEQERSFHPGDPDYPDIDLYKTEKVKAVAKSIRPVAYSHRHRVTPLNPLPANPPSSQSPQSPPPSRRAKTTSPSKKPKATSPKKWKQKPTPRKTVAGQIDTQSQILDLLSREAPKSALGIYLALPSKPTLAAYKKTLKALQKTGEVEGFWQNRAFIYRLGRGR